jgi:hypothetical protein
MQSQKKQFGLFLVPLSVLGVLSVFGSVLGMFSPSLAEAQTAYNAIKNVGGKCLDVQNGYVYTNGIGTQIWECNGTTAQQWQFSGETIRNAAGKCLDIQSGQIYTDGQLVWLYDCNGTNAQRWTISSSGEIRNPVSQKCLDVRNGWIGTIGTPVQIYSCNGTNAQKWSANSTFNITWNYLSNSSKSALGRTATADAVNTWMSKIQSGPLGSPVQNGFTVNVIEDRTIGYQIYASADYAQNGVATLRINPDWFFQLRRDGTPVLSDSQKQKVIMHELAHSMGFGQQRSPEYFNNVRCGSNLAVCYLTGNNISAVYGSTSVPLQGNVNVSRISSRTEGFGHFWEGDPKLQRDLMSAATLEGYSDSDLKFTIATLKDMGFSIK